ncbi:MAG TPA: C25 family cysteine peptidase, partial [Salinibacter sp.]|nr:C25 family cysteine peptidase [Salinibacter sp.]
MSSPRLLGLVLVWWVLVAPLALQAQSGDGYDASWYDPDRPHLQIDVTEDGVYRVAASALRSALPDGTTLSDISPGTIRLFENGEEIPIQVNGASDGTLDASDTITFVGHRNRGSDEEWAYNYDQSAQSSTYYSLYSDTTTYWMTWGGTNGLRYEESSLSSSAAPTSTLRDTVHVEQDNRYYFGRPGDNGDPIYTRSEGYYWERFSHNDTTPISFEAPLPVGRRTATSTDLDLTVRLDAATNSCHRVEVAAELRQSDGSLGFETLRTAEWEDTERQTLTASVPQQEIPEGGLTVRLTSYNDNFPDEVDGRTCPDPSSTPNYVLLDWMEAAYTRSLTATDNTQRFVPPDARDYNFALSNHSGPTVHVYNPRNARRFEAPVTNGTASITASPSAPATPYWAVGDGAFRTPASIRPDTPSNWSAPSANGADYVLLTTKALLPAAQQLADYRRTHDGYDVEIALVQNVFDEFDYGRPTPIAIRRFVRATQDWNPAPRFLSIFADAQYPIRDGSVSTLYPEWSVPSFGYAPSDGWYAMQTDGPQDWSEVLAVGRIPVRSVAQGELFVEKLKSYESAPLERWQKRMLLLAGGTSESEQESLQQYSNWWGEIAADTVA